MTDSDPPDVGDDEPVTPSQERSETPQLVALRATGYGADFEIDHGRLVLVGTGPIDVADVHIDRHYRFEGASDPEYESMILALHVPATGSKGVLITAYGPSASAGEAEVLSALAVVPDCTG